MTVDTSLVARIARRAREEHDDLPVPVSAASIGQAESAVGFPLHPLLAAVYQTVANGGFGPEYLVLPLLSADGANAETAVRQYLNRRAGSAGSPLAWPEGVLPILHWGCGMYACVDCRTDAGVVLMFEPNPGDPDLAWYVEAPSLATWFEHYLNDTGWWDAVEAGEEVDLRPWPDAKARV